MTALLHQMERLPIAVQNKLCYRHRDTSIQIKSALKVIATIDKIVRNQLFMNTNQLCYENDDVSISAQAGPDPDERLIGYSEDELIKTEVAAARNSIRSRKGKYRPSGRLCRPK